MDKNAAPQPTATPPIVDRAAFDSALAEQVAREKELTHHGDNVSARRRRLPMVQVPDYTFTGADGQVLLSELFGDKYLLLIQNVMYAPEWEEGCPSCSWAVDNLPANMQRVDEEGIAFAMVSQAPIAKLTAWGDRHGWPHRWVSSFDTTYHHDWGWTRLDDEGAEYQLPGYSYYLLVDGVPYLTYMTTARGTEAILPLAHIMDRTVYGRQQDWEDSPTGWPQAPTYG